LGGEFNLQSEICNLKSIEDFARRRQDRRADL
jgi:hypothetical protein